MAATRVASAWEAMPYLVTQGQKGELVTYNNPNGAMNRRDVVNNAETLGPLIAELGIWAELALLSASSLYNSSEVTSYNIVFILIYKYPQPAQVSGRRSPRLGFAWRNSSGEFDPGENHQLKEP